MTGAVKRIGNAAALRSVAGPAARAELDCIASEGFRESDLILARHRAHAEGLSFSGDLDAIRVLRKNGMSIAPKPSKADRFPQIVSQEEIDAAEARDRRKKVRGAVARIAAFVAAPTAAAAAYFLHFATPMYSTYSEFVIQRPDSLQQGDDRPRRRNGRRGVERWSGCHFGAGLPHLSCSIQ